MVKSDLIESENWVAISTKCHEAISALHGFAFKGIVQACDTAQASALHGALAPFGLGFSSAFSSKPDIFTSNECQVNKLVISTNNLDRATSYLKYYGYTCTKCNNVPNVDICCDLQPKVGQYGIVLVQTK